MNIKDIINKERWKLLPHHLTRVKQHNAALERIEAAVLKRITELEAQLPKVVTPRPSGDGSYDCDCDEDGVGGLYRTDAYCYKCGAKLNWEEA